MLKLRSGCVSSCGDLVGGALGLLALPKVTNTEKGGGGWRGGHDIRWTAWLFQTAHARHAIPPWPLQYLPWLKRGAVSCTGRLCVVCPQPPLPQQRLQNLCSGHQLAPHLHRRVSSCQWGAVTEPPQLRGAGAAAEASRVQNMVLGGVRVY